MYGEDHNDERLDGDDAAFLWIQAAVQEILETGNSPDCPADAETMTLDGVQIAPKREQRTSEPSENQ